METKKIINSKKKDFIPRNIKVPQEKSLDETEPLKESLASFGENQGKKTEKKKIEEMSSLSLKLRLKSHKAEMFQKSLNELKLEKMQVTYLEDERNTAVFFANVDIGNNKLLPLTLIIDDTIYTVLRITVAKNVLTSSNTIDVIDHLNYLNRQYKPFKYFIGEDGNLYLDYCETFINDLCFDTRVIRLIMDVTADQIRAEYPGIMKKLEN